MSRSPKSPEEEDIPYAFARTIQHDLATTGYVRTVRGSRGGLQLAIDPKTVTVLDLLHALQGPVSVSACAADPDTCPKNSACAFNRMWQAADRALAELFGSITLYEVLEADADLPGFKQSVDRKADRAVDEHAGAHSRRGPGSCPASRQIASA